MTNKQVTYKFFIAGVFIVAAIAALLKLGFWQLDRLAWKEGLLAQIAQYQSTPAQDVALLPYLQDKSAEFRRGYLKGRWVAADTFKTKPRLMDNNFGYWIVTPLTLADGSQIVVNRGWVADKQEDGVLATVLPQGDVTVFGSLRRPGALEDYKQIEGKGPWVLFMESSEPKDHRELVPAPVAVEMPNDHKQYAIFWFTMAGLLTAFGIFSLLRRR